MQSIITKIMSTPVQPHLWHEALDAFNDYFELPSSALFSFNSINNVKKDVYISEFLRTRMGDKMREYLASDQDNDVEAYHLLLKFKAQTLHHEATIVKGIAANELDVA